MKPRFRLGPHSRPAELLAALGAAIMDYQSRDYIYIPYRRQLIPHATARRDYVCECGARLVTKCDNGNWRTVCSASEYHKQEGFLPQAVYLRREAQKAARAAEGG